MKITILGAGLIGRLLAWQLLEQSAKSIRVEVFEQSSSAAEMSAAQVAAAMLAPSSELLDAEASVYLQGLAGLQVWQSWQNQLQANLGKGFDLRLQGSLLLAHRQDQGNFSQLWQKIQRNQLLDQTAITLLNAKQLAELEPDLVAGFEQACWLQNEGCLDNQKLLDNLLARILQLGGQVNFNQKVAQLDANSFPSADVLIDCRGIGAKSAMPKLRGVRGEILRVYAPEVEISRPVRLLHPRYKLYLVPRENQNYVIGATQIETEDSREVTLRSSLELLSALYSLHPGFAEAEILKLEARNRPALPNNLPLISQQARLIQINGLYRHGFLLAPAVIHQTLDLLGLPSSLRWPEIVQTNQSLEF